MTELQTLRVKALLALVHEGQETGKMKPHVRKFIQDMARLMDWKPGFALSEKQAEFLKRLAWSYRWQIPVALRPAENPYERNLWPVSEEEESVPQKELL